MQPILKHLFQADTLEDVSRERLEAFVEEYPSFGIGHLLLSRKLRNEDATDSHFFEETRRTNLYFTNPFWLQWLLENTGGSAGQHGVDSSQQVISKSTAPIIETAPVSETVFIAETTSIAETAPVPEDTVSIPLMRLAERQETEEMPDQTESFSSLPVPGQEEPIRDEEPPFILEEIAPSIHEEITPDIHEPAPAEPEQEEPEQEELEHEEPELTAPVSDPAPAESRPEPVNNIGSTLERAAREAGLGGEPNGHPAAEPAPLAFEPYHTIDYFASQGIKLSQEEIPGDTLGRQLKSFTDWLKVMRKLPQKEREIIPDIAAERNIQTIAAHSIQGKDVVTETMAEVLAKQGMPEKAREVYEKLSLLNPGKRAYFATKIQQLNIH